MLRRALVVADDAGRAADPKHVAVLVDVTLVAGVPSGPVEQTAGKLPAGLDVVSESDVLGGALPQFFVGIADHLAERRVYPEETLIEGEDGHADRRAFEKLAKNRVAGSQASGGAKVGDGRRKLRLVHAKEKRRNAARVVSCLPASCLAGGVPREASAGLRVACLVAAAGKRCACPT